MKGLLIILLLTPLFGFGQSLKIKAELFSFAKEKIPPFCGYQKETGLLKFRILESKNELRKGDFIFTYLVCPRETIEKIGIEKFANYKECSITINQKELSRKKISRRTVEMFYKEGNENLKIFGFSNLELLE